MNVHVELRQMYDIYRDCALNKEYYAERLVRFQRLNTAMELGIALFASGSALSALDLMSTDPGKKAWPYLAALSAVLALVKPFLRLNRKIERYSRLYTGHLDNYLQMHRLVLLITRKQAVTDEMRRQFERALNRYVELSRDDEPAPSSRLLARCQKLVGQRIPCENLWYPISTHPPSQSSRTEPPLTRPLAIVAPAAPQEA